MQNSLKYFDKAKMYKNSTGTVKLNMNTLEAYSYDHWKFAKPGSAYNTILFNVFKYSVTTQSHQRVVRRQLEELGFQILEVCQKESL